ncbi:small GTP-binding protein, putative [Trichomonas vaginalis G3]|uniref:Small GTP-binding protein, putative n=1 Tax=Trichomonas vaginalis (strain ATCC PRA-98 / G3) TaxID=412133 RepID=A2EVE6_TRIV3|nr:regulation of endocytosis [Trichomonas vaginalis G3]EAY03392.1 small GTP-binding protein, putative [Trichomonas vaginalis G3]KAI5538074.1 regulation of endocytosis [Trichomonas vaginalis G3]|eukprot:XP_001315615.1 small GTP-binding protein [Trichomonas vaginalis G3]
MTQPLSYKVVIVGNTQVGKTCIVDKLVTGAISDDVTPTIGASFLTFTIKKPKGPIKLHIWDTAGQEKFMSITSTYYRNAHFALLVFDLSDRNSFNNLGRWLGDLKGNAPPEVKIILVGNKKDLENERAITKEEAETFVSENNLLYYMEVSALTGDRIRELFQGLVNIDTTDALDVIQHKRSEEGSSCC